MNYYTEVLKKYAVFDGRARRKEYWMFFLWNCIVSVVLSVLLAVIGLALHVGPLNYLVWIYSLAVLLPTIGVGIRRLHDTGRTGWWLLIGLIPLLGAIVILIFTVQDSQPGDNQYGLNPKRITSAPTA